MLTRANARLALKVWKLILRRWHPRTNESLETTDRHLKRKQRKEAKMKDETKRRKREKWKKIIKEAVERFVVQFIWLKRMQRQPRDAFIVKIYLRFSEFGGFLFFGRNFSTTLSASLTSLTALPLSSSSSSSSLSSSSSSSKSKSTSVSSECVVY